MTKVTSIRALEVSDGAEGRGAPHDQGAAARGIAQSAADARGLIIDRSISPREHEPRKRPTEIRDGSPRLQQKRKLTWLLEGDRMLRDFQDKHPLVQE